MERILLVLMVLGMACRVCYGSEAKKPAGRADYGGYRPHFQGYGVNTKGGRGGKVLRVTNLNDSGPGSLRAALESEGPRIVIFETSGTIALESHIVIADPYLTIAGQTAPSPGINIRNWGFLIKTHDVVIQHIRFRYGDTHNKKPGTDLVIRVCRGDAKDIVLDHVSMAWSMYMSMGATAYDPTDPPNYGFDSGGNPTRISLLDCILAWPLSKMDVDPAYCGANVGMGYPPSTTDNQYTYARNLLVHSAARNPIAGAGRAQVVNTVVYGAGPWGPEPENQLWTFFQYRPNNDGDPKRNQQPNWSYQAVVINTVTIPSTGTGSGNTAGSTKEMKPFVFDVHPDNLQYQDTKIWLSGNQGPYITGPDPAGQKAGIYWCTAWGGQDFSNDPRLWYPSEPDWHASQHFWTIPAAETTDHVLANAGARPLDRDSVDTAAVSQTKAGIIHDLPNMGSRITSQEDMGGHPVLPVHARKLQVPENPNAVAPGQKFRTKIEMWLEKYARELEPAL